MPGFLSQRKLPLIFLAIGLLALGFMLVQLLPRHSSAADIGGPFALHTPDGRTLTQADFAGAPFLVFFGYTHCPDVCPTTLNDVSQILGKFPKSQKIGAAFITVDPERDTPALMQDFMGSFDPRLVALTGTAAELAPVYKEYRVYHKKVEGKNGDYTMDHTALVYLMDKGGQFVGSFNTAQTPEAGAKELEKYF